MLRDLMLQKVTITQILIPKKHFPFVVTVLEVRGQCVIHLMVFKPLHDLALHGVLYLVAFCLLSNQ